MITVLDAIVGFVWRASETWLGIIVISSPLWLLALRRVRQHFEHRSALRDFAAAHRLQYLGTIPSDTRAPYTRIERVARGVLLSNVVEGQWDGLPIHMFDLPSRAETSWTTVLVKVEGRLYHGAEAERVIAAGPEALIETNLDVLCVSPQARLDDRSELSRWLSFATTLAKAMERDAKQNPSFDTPNDTPPPPRTMFGVPTAD